MDAAITRAKSFVMEDGTNLQKTALQYILEESDKKELIAALAPYQNSDGGWSNGLEIEYQGNVSSALSTAAALGHIYRFELGKSELSHKTLQYLQTTQNHDGSWDESPEIIQFNIPDYMKPGASPVYTTGMIVRWLKQLNADHQMISGAAEYLKHSFPVISTKPDFWAACGYVNAFSSEPITPETKTLLKWAAGILAPPTDDNDSSSTRLPWFKIQGMIHDASPMLRAMMEDVVISIKENQLPNGSWPHQFGVYNQVWAAVLIIRFIIENNLN